MKTYQIAVVVGSLRDNSVNERLALAIQKLAPADFAFTRVGIGDLPLYNQDDDASPAPSVKRLKAQILAADGAIIVTPEYNRSIPGVLKNALDHGSRPYGKSVWAGKPAAILGLSPGPIGTALAQQHLRSILGYLDMPVLGQPEAYLQATDALFDADGNIGASSKDFLQSWMDAFASWVRLHSDAQAVPQRKRA